MCVASKQQSTRAVNTIAQRTVKYLCELEVITISEIVLQVIY